MRKNLKISHITIILIEMFIDLKCTFTMYYIHIGSGKLLFNAGKVYNATKKTPLGVGSST